MDIDERPAIVDTRTRIGDWEVDLVIGKGHKGGFARDDSPFKNPTLLAH
ncbi:Mobile element protein [hydrothermal vent metagenome]|uniref:Mobile element protein n=1 Tax=hydrothermal vent metagenome TaxID=652676 RepID=A0A1W1DXY2_9ZZZZ